MPSSNVAIYTGFWTNRSSGKINGSTLTLSAEHSAFLVAFVALFVKFVGGQLWSIITYLTSIKRSTPEPRDGLYHQQQAALKNTSQPTVFVWDMLKLSWFWKDTASKSRARTLGFITSTIAYIGAFAIAGIFSSKVASNNSEVLLLPAKNCGLWHYPWLTLWDPASSWSDYNIQRISYWANTYELARQTHVQVAQCYNSTGDHSPNACLPYGNKAITWTTVFNLSCPFDEGLCIDDAIQFDTGFLSSRNHFGINTKDHIEYRRVMTCAPITTDGYVSDYVNVTGLNISYENAQQGYFDGETWRKYMYGNNYYFNDNTSFAYSNFTWGASFDPNSGVDIYRLDAELSSPGYDGGIINWPFLTAIDPLSRNDADTTLVFLALNSSYLSPVEDPWFRATVSSTQEAQIIGGGVREYKVYDPDKLVNVVACAEQHQFRNPATGYTSRLAGQEIFSYVEQAKMGFNEHQQIIYNQSFFIGQNSLLINTVSALDAALLLAGQFKWGDQLTGLPPNQWQLEFNHYFGVAIHTMQLWTLQFISGLNDPMSTQYIKPASTDFEKYLCEHQIIRRADYRSFSVLGLCIILVFGLIFIALNLSVESIVQWVQGHTVEGRYRNAEWQANDFLQLQRMAYEHKDIGTWQGHDAMVPVTRFGEKFMIPDSTKWNEGLETSNQTGRKMPQIFARGARLPRTDISNSSIEEPVASSKEDGKDVQITEIPVTNSSETKN